MYKRITLLLWLLLCMQPAKTQIISGGGNSSSFSSVPASYPVYLQINDPSIISSVTVQGKPIFTVSAINTLVNAYTVTGFERAFPNSRFQDMRRMYKMNVSSLALPADLTTAYSQYFPYYEAIHNATLAYTPVDYPNYPLSGIPTTWNI